MISIFTAYKNGLELVWKAKKLLFLIYGINFIFAYLMAMPMSMLLSKSLAKTTAAEKMLESFDYALFTSIMDNYGQGLSLSRALITMGVFYLIINIFLSGGILSVFVKGKKFNFTEFISDCVLFFKRFMKLFLLSLIFIISAILLYMLISKLFGYLTQDAATEHLSLILFIVRVVLLVMMLAFINLLFDYARIMTVVNDYTKMMETVKLAMMFIMMSLVKTVSLYKLYLFTVIFVLAIYWVVESVIHVNSGLMVLLFFIWSQMFMILKLWVRLGFFAGQYSFYHYSNTAMPGMNKEMLDEAVTNYDLRLQVSE